MQSQKAKEQPSCFVNRSIEGCAEPGNFDAIFNQMVRESKEDKPTAVKRPAKPLHRDEPNYPVNYFQHEEETPAIFLGGEGEDKAYTIRGSKQQGRSE